MKLIEDKIYYYHNDHLGTPLAMTDESGNVVWKASYTPFGEAVVDPSSSVTNNFRFPGQYYDQESGLHYNYHRYYDPRTGRYLRADPVNIASTNLHLKIPGCDDEVPLLEKLLANPLNHNLYNYGINNPIKNIDPKGNIVITSTTVAIIGGLAAVAPLAYYGYQCLKWWGRCFDEIMDYRKKCPDAFPQDVYEKMKNSEACKKMMHYCPRFATSSYTF